MWDHIINNHSSELLCIKTKEFRINEHKNILKIDNLHFLPNKILTRLFKELKRKKEKKKKKEWLSIILKLYI